MQVLSGKIKFSLVISVVLHCGIIFMFLGLSLWVQSTISTGNSFNINIQHISSVNKKNKTNTESNYNKLNHSQHNVSNSKVENNTAEDYTTLISSKLLVHKKFIAPSYPYIAKNNSWQGLVLIKATIENNGNVAQSTVHVSSGYNVLDMAAIKAVNKWQFNNLLEKSVDVIIPVNFILK